MIKMHLILCFGFLSLTSSFGQSILNGKYSTGQNGEDIVASWKFENGRFQETSFQHLGMQEISTGYYWTLNDTLFLFYERTPRPLNYLVESKQKQVDILGIPINETQVFIETSNKVPVTILLKSIDD
ncbi:MAG TPA: hypothetical protein VFE57_09535, partial [Cyclobacteriaceae bacterium]|nr:hypothetical protein [Cyclobacteriaceae bacterium]